MSSSEKLGKNVTNLANVDIDDVVIPQDAEGPMSNALTELGLCL